MVVLPLVLMVCAVHSLKLQLPEHRLSCHFIDQFMP